MIVDPQKIEGVKTWFSIASYSSLKFCRSFLLLSNVYPKFFLHCNIFDKVAVEEGAIYMAEQVFEELSKSKDTIEFNSLSFYSS